MIHFEHSSLTARTASLVTLALSITLTGCAGFSGARFPDASANPAQIRLGAIQGSNFGGHAPLVGAHVFVLQPNTGTSNGDGSTGYGAEPKSLLTATSTSGYPTTQDTVVNSNGGAQVGWYYVTTDSTGAFNISGDYTCTAGVPVYLYAFGGSPTFPSANNQFNIAQVAVSSGSSPYTVTFTLNTTISAPPNGPQPIENAYIGEPFTIAGLTGNAAFLNGSSGTVVGTNLTTTTFATTVTSLTGNSVTATAGSTYTQTGTNQVTFLPNFNNGVVNVAVLGNCPSSVTDAGFGNSISYVYMNEVSTAAWAYAFQGFSVGNSNSAYIGAPATNLVGLQNAALNAAQLYDIQGSSITTSYAGEGHIARPLTPAGNGIVPQATLDTVGNILAQCVDSQNTAPAGNQVLGTTGLSVQCTTLFTYATVDGTPVMNGGQQSYDTATAALNIARNPAGKAAYTSTFMSQLYGLPTANVPFTPHLTAQPNDFGVAILYPKSKTVGTTTVTNSNISEPESVAVDAAGAVWVDDHGTDEVYKYSPQGVLDFTINYSTVPGYLSIDPTGNAWVGNAANTTSSLLTKINPTGTIISTGGTTTTGYVPYDATTGYNAYLYNGYSIAVDGTGNVYTGDANTTHGYRLSQYNNSTGAATGGTYENNVISAMATCFGNGADVPGSSSSPDRHIDHIAVDASANLWLSSEGQGFANEGTVCKVDSTGKAVTGFTTALKGISTTTTVDEFISIDKSGNAWIPNGYGGTPGLLEVSSSGTATPYTTGATLTYPFGSTIDGNNTVWVVDRTTGTLANFSIANSAYVSPSTNYKFSGSTSSLTSGGLNLAVDPSGDLWMTDYFNSNLVEVIGIAAPSATPLSVAAKNGTIGTKP